jgi:hypothetical protein
MYILIENCTKFQLKSIPLIDAYLWREKTLQSKKHDKYGKQARNYYPLLSTWRIREEDLQGVTD